MRPWYVLPAVALGVAGCGGGSPAPSVASLGTAAATPTTTHSAVQGFAAFVSCMDAHGVPSSVGPDGRGVSITGEPGQGRLDSAQSACRHLLPGGGPPTLSPAQQALRARSLAKLAACMRKHGVTNFPDDVNPDTMQGIDPTAPVFRAAYKVCWSLYPRVGPQIGIAP